MPQDLRPGTRDWIMDRIAHLEAEISRIRISLPSVATSDKEILRVAMDAVLLATGASWVSFDHQGIKIGYGTHNRTILWHANEEAS